LKRIGVFVCWCGLNIAGTVDVKRVAQEMAAYPGVVHAEDYKYMCSDPGQALIKEAIKKKRLDGVVVAACSPNMHEATFRACGEAAGLNPYQVEIANIREQNSWVHQDKEAATLKALDLVKAMVEKTKLDAPLHPSQIPVTRRALVIGGGISGMTAALEIANAGIPVVLVEKKPHIGGQMALLSETFPTLDCSSCILTPKMAEVGRHKGITLLTHSEVAEVSGYVGNFKVKVRRRPTYVDWTKCVGCMECQEKCPKRFPSDFERGLGLRKAIGVAFPQAVPYRPVIEASQCTYFKTGKCRVCEKVCPVNAVDFRQQERIEEVEVGAIVVASGFELADMAQMGEYGYGEYPDVIDGLGFERLNSSSGPTNGRIVRPSDGKTPKEVVFIQCVGSRDEEKGRPYCSKICCMYTAKHAKLYKHKVPDGKAYVFYMDIRAGGKGYEEFVQQAIEQEEVLYLRGRVSRIYPEDGKIMVNGTDTLSGRNVSIAADMVVLATAVVPRKDSKDLARLLKLGTDAYGFFNEAHPKLRPVESLTRGVFLAGCAQAPRDIPETVAQAGGAAAKVITMLSAEHLTSDPTVARVNQAICSGCLWCANVCPYEAITPVSVEERVGPNRRVRQVASVNVGLCQGCGACTVACRDGAMNLDGFTTEQILAEVESLCL